MNRMHGCLDGFGVLTSGGHVRLMTGNARIRRWALGTTDKQGKRVDDRRICCRLGGRLPCRSGRTCQTLIHVQRDVPMARCSKQSVREACVGLGLKQRRRKPS